MIAGAGVLLHAFLLQLAAYMIRPTAAYRALELGADPAVLGLVAASFAVVPLLIAVIAGRWIDAGNGRAALPLGAVAMVCGGAGLLWAAPTLWALLAWNVLIGLGHLLGILGEQNAVAQAGAGRIDSAFGFYTFVVSGGQAVAPLLISLVGGAAVIPPTHTLFLVFLIACVALAVVSFLIWRRTGDRTVQPQRLPSMRSALRLDRARRRTMVGGILASMFVLGAIDLVQIYLPALGVERQIPAWVIGMLLAVRATATMLSRLGMGRLAARFGRGPLITATTFIGSVAVALIAIPMDPWLLGVLLVVAGFSLGLGQPLSMAVISVAAPPGTLATWLAVRLSANRFGQSGIPALLSLFALGAGTGPVFLATGVMLLLTAGVTALTLPRSSDA